MNLKICGKIRLRNPQINRFVTWKRSGQQGNIWFFPRYVGETHTQCAATESRKTTTSKIRKVHVSRSRGETRLEEKTNRSDATWESQIEQGACSKPNALSSSFLFCSTCPSLPSAFPHPATRKILGSRVHAYDSRPTCFFSSALVSPAGDIECHVNGTRSIRYKFPDV